MNKLQTEAVLVRLQEKGMNQAGLATTLGVSRESVSKWLKGESLPRPDKLLRLALALGMSRSQLLGTDPAPDKPQVAFRMAKGKAAQDYHLSRAEHMGKMLESLVPYLPFDALKTPPVLKNPSTDYDYLQQVATGLRQEMGATPNGPINIGTLSAMFEKLQAVVVPVLWGHRKQHENAIHLYLPRSTTTWVYLNLDARMCDLKFWLAHELGHTFTFSPLKGEAGEEFADAFAGALLFPEGAAQAAYRQLTQLPKMADRVHLAMRIAADLEISPVCVAKQIDKFARVRGHQVPFDENKLLYQMHERAKPETASKWLLGEGEIELSKLVSVTKEIFHSPFYDALKRFMSETGPNPGFVQGVLDCSLIDAKQVCSELA